MIARQWASSLASCFFTATSLGVPSSARRSVSSAITSRNIEVLLSGIGPHVEGVQRAGQHRIVADGGRQLDHALEPEPLAHGRERRVVHAPRREQAGDAAAAARDLREDRLLRGRQVLRPRDERDARHQSIAACTALLTRSIRWPCQGSGTRLLVTYAKDTPESGSAQQYDEPTPPWPNVRGEASEPRPRMVSVVPRRCGPRPRCIGIPM